MKKTYLSLFIICILAIGCKTATYIYALDASITKTNRTDSDSLDFDFKIAGNGLWFNIKNNTNSNSFLLWEESYITLPSGNSFKMFNPDMLEENVLDKNIALKSQNTGIIPAHKSYSRFSSSISSLGKVTNIVSYNWDYYNFFYSYSSLAKNSFTTQYWPLNFTNQTRASDELSLQENTSIIFSNPALAAGFTIEQNGLKKELHFDFRVDTVKLFQLSKSQTAMYYVGHCTNTGDGVKCTLIPKKQTVNYIQLKSSEIVIGIINDSMSSNINILNLKSGEVENYSKNNIEKFGKYQSSMGGNYYLKDLLKE
tara:strand:- start:63 stop:995 length:933 start_codon:yes stop_codon:yes gene_type:complete